MNPRFVCFRSCFVQKTVSRSGSSKRWIDRHVNDPYVKRAAAEDYRSRAAFKLIEINDRFKFLKQEDIVVDLGAAPGGWSQVASKLLSKEPSVDALHRIFAIDLLPMKDLSGVTFIQGDFNKEYTMRKVIQKLGQASPTVVLSDMLHNTTGNSITDHFRSMDLCFGALTFCQKHLQKGGTFLCKFLNGPDDKELTIEAKKMFADVKIVKPNSSRKESSENYLLARGKRASLVP